MNTKRFDIVDFLDSEEDMAAYLDAVIELNNPKLLQAALGDIARAKGMSSISSETGLSRESLYKSLCEQGNPRFETLAKVLDSLGLRFSIAPKRTA